MALDIAHNLAAKPNKLGHEIDVGRISDIGFLHRRVDVRLRRIGKPKRNSGLCDYVPLRALRFWRKPTAEFRDLCRVGTMPTIEHAPSREDLEGSVVLEIVLRLSVGKVVELLQ